jgi:hypothetical protein
MHRLCSRVLVVMLEQASTKLALRDDDGRVSNATGFPAPG